MHLTFYHLKNEPFHIAPDPNFLFMSPSHKDALDTIIHSIDERRGFILITGKAGTGKTTIIRSYLDRFARAQIKPIAFSNGDITFEKLMKTLFRNLGAIPEQGDMERMLAQLRKLLIKQHKEDNIIALFIDDAQDLPLETLEKLPLLSNMERGGEKLVQIVLAGTPEIKKRLNSGSLRQFKQDFEIQATLFPLSLEESKKYIDHRLSLASSDSKPVFTPHAIKQIVKHARGNPHALNTLCHNSLITGFDQQCELINLKIANEVVKASKAKGKHPFSLWKFA